MAEFVLRQHFRVLFVQPQRRGGGGGGQIDRDAGFAELVDVDTIVMDRDPDDAVATSITETVDDARPNLVIAGA